MLMMVICVWAQVPMQYIHQNTSLLRYPACHRKGASHTRQSCTLQHLQANTRPHYGQASVNPPTHTRYTQGMLHFLLDYSSTLLALYTTNPSTGEWLWKVPLSSWLFALWNLYSFHGEFPLHTHRHPRKLPNFLTVTYHQTCAQQFVTVAEGH